MIALSQFLSPTITNTDYVGNVDTLIYIALRISFNITCVKVVVLTLDIVYNLGVMALVGLLWDMTRLL